MPITTQEAVQTLVSTLRDDPNLYEAYQANIAMAMYETYVEKHGGYFDPRPTLPEMHTICNQAADRFLTMLSEGAPYENAPLNGAPHSVKPETYLEKLTDLQDKIGYTVGKIHPVALMGLLGEVGEVADESCFVNADEFPDDQVTVVCQRAWDIMNQVNGFVEKAQVVDGLKKQIRKLENAYIQVEYHPVKFPVELADAFYYLKAVARGANLTIEDLARISYEKVMERRGVVNEGDPAR